MSLCVPLTKSPAASSTANTSLPSLRGCQAWGQLCPSQVSQLVSESEGGPKGQGTRPCRGTKSPKPRAALWRLGARHPWAHALSG
jgi:hypothetical protein